ncbi:hypothetical protein F5X98DRAFT_359936 [Xylaria grammica]|nr:hypothetical protein F5X98DRAFT_359936 [Xylaria grammica]
MFLYQAPNKDSRFYYSLIPHLSQCQRVEICLLVKQVLAPELESIEALQEFLQARKTLDCCAGSTRNGLKLSQSFFIGMMGVRYRTRTHGVLPRPAANATRQFAEQRACVLASR